MGLANQFPILTLRCNTIILINFYWRTSRPLLIDLLKWIVWFAPTLYFSIIPIYLFVRNIAIPYCETSSPSLLVPKWVAIRNATVSSILHPSGITLMRHNSACSPFHFESTSCTYRFPGSRGKAGIANSSIFKTLQRFFYYHISCWCANANCGTAESSSLLVI